jgi:hypothetical protein
MVAEVTVEVDDDGTIDLSNAEINITNPILTEKLKKDGP